MDLLGSILGGMGEVKPKKQLDEAAQKRIKDAKLKATKFKEAEQRQKAKFRTQMEERINNFISSEETKITFEPMNKATRSVLHDVAEVAGLTSYSFGEEEVDRHLVVWKKENAPSDAELEALKQGETYDPEAAAKMVEQVKQTTVHREERKETGKKRSKTNEPAGEKYFEKYAKIVGGTSGIQAAAVTQSNKNYGMVPSKQKEDKRSIEETMNDIRERKLKKT